MDLTNEETQQSNKMLGLVLILEDNLFVQGLLTMEMQTIARMQDAGVLTSVFEVKDIKKYQHYQKTLTISERHQCHPIVIAAMGKLLHLLYVALKNQMPFDPNYCAQFHYSSPCSNRSFGYY